MPFNQHIVTITLKGLANDLIAAPSYNGIAMIVPRKFDEPLRTSWGCSRRYYM